MSALESWVSFVKNETELIQLINTYIYGKGCTTAPVREIKRIVF